ncbi:hypothetical protein Hdeb2414_s0006g00217161 [Helianthus debilis subsp. tardiflorus]
MNANGSYFSGVEDPLSRLLGPEHGGRLRTVSNIIGRTKAKGGLFQGARQQSQTDVSTTQRLGVVCDYRGVDSSPSIRGVSDELAECELLFPSPSIKEKVVGLGLVYPTMDRLLDDVQMEDGYVKVKVDIIDPKFENSPLPLVSGYDEVTDLGDARGKYVQWPRFAIKTISKCVVLN